MRDAHAVSIEELVRRLGTDPRRGLVGGAAKSRLREVGPNELPRSPRRSLLLLFLGRFRSGLIVILLLAAALSLAVGEGSDAAGIMLAVLIDAVIGFAQERRAETAIERLRDMVARETSVVRDGMAHRVPAAAVVPGDLLIIEEGARVPADARIVECRDLRADESALTGESAPVSKRAGPSAPDVPLPDRQGMLWMGTTVVSGSARAVAVETGPRTAFGTIATSLKKIRRERSPLERQLDRLGRQFGVVAAALAALALLLGVARGFPTVDMVFFAVAMLVSVVPEGLPAVLAIVLAIAVQRMARRKAIVRHVPSVETLGAADVICTDKTGTLTENKMTVREIATPGLSVTVTGEGWDPRGGFFADGATADPRSLPELDDLLRAVGRCARARIEYRDGRPGIVGDPTEGALAVVAAKAGLDEKALGRDYAKVDGVPFSSSRKYGATLEDRIGADGVRSRRLFAVGAYDVLRDRCGASFGTAVRERFDRINRDMGGRALRVVAVVAKDMPATQDAVSDADLRGLSFLGLVGMIDPPRAGVADAVSRCRAAGIRVIMLTGDQKATASAIAREIGLIDGAADGLALTETEAARLDDGEFAEAVARTAVFARVSPETKLRIVGALQHAGAIVAMTGDGVNDAPALKKASIGVAMGLSGTDVSKEVADIVLADDDFVSIVDAVEEGRTAFRNVKQTTAYLFMTNVGEAVTVLATLALGMPLPLLPAQILWMNLVTDGLPDIALSMEPAADDVLDAPPRGRDAPIITRGVIALTAVSSVLMCAGTIAVFAAYLRAGDVVLARTMAFTTMAVFQLWNVFCMRSATKSVFSLGLRSNPYVTWAVAASFGLQLAVLYVPGLTAAFKTRPLGAWEWMVVLLTTSSLLAAVETWKAMVRRGIVPRAWL